MIVATGAIAAGEHRRALRGEALLGAVVDRRNAGQRQHRQQRLPERGVAAAGQESVDIMVVDEGRHPPRVGMHRHHVADAVREFGGWTPAREHIAEAAVQRIVDHRWQAVGRTHVSVKFASLHIPKWLVGAEAFAEGQEIVTAGGARDGVDTWCRWIAGMQEVGEELRGHVERGVDTERIDTDLPDPPAIGRAQGTSHDGVLGIQIVKTSQLEIQHLVAIAEIRDVGRPVIDRLRRAGPDRARRCDRMAIATDACGRANPHPASKCAAGSRGFQPPAYAKKFAVWLTTMSCTRYMPAPCSAVGQRLVVGERADVRIDRAEVFRPVAVVAAEVALGVPPLVGHRRA